MLTLHMNAMIAAVTSGFNDPGSVAGIFWAMRVNNSLLGESLKSSMNALSDRAGAFGRPCRRTAAGRLSAERPGETRARRYGAAGGARKFSSADGRVHAL